MVTVKYEDTFKSKVKKANDFLKLKIYKQVEKIIENPLIVKPMRYERKGTRELYIKPCRLSYAYNEKEKIIILLDLFHKKEQ
ncbi:MAG: type II toxin-antitoxin system RelE/ParE family toxin [Nanoarchaeota archaeon]|nr:type II toxin-antitoxin system RelE/ParE family toxin [Nanoarchaeota archaeon]MBU1320789.1 type II toxin-antitoxin system RelE/ParE family toxin [Nanoarchaeota archaeon]MBU1598294.1 type II toxin-antitoxin system RelE/ParE family toxin [Nanoarchaeota archaeon]MBU2442258.1 type II toxin-antitoxin system RelE/ParE family toxin [Nanoarchaeota archaeon]